MSYAAFKKSRPKTAINFSGYSRGLDVKSRVKMARKNDQNFNVLEYLSDSVKEELNKHYKIKNDSASNLNKLPTSKSLKQASITVDLSPVGESKVSIITSNPSQNENLINKKVKSVENQIGNFDAIQTIVAKLNNKLSTETDEKVCEKYRERIKNLNGYMELLKFCFKYLGKSGNDVEDVNSDFFQVVSKDPIEVTIENSEMKYRIEDVLKKYFENISKTVQEASDVEVIFFS